ncbi:MAG: class II aldolase/adducin family protein [Candidatus Methanomethyliaceae archaeon]|nr:class II aldolase/adducin family protein [Candidatus Methanomethyliaceae archaeon]MDW7971119.1 class II aldolase/adducin family protein [Nitrososphaerota archaeon]
MEEFLRKELVKCMKYLHTKGLISGIGGNASVRLSENEVLITPSGLLKAELHPSDIVKIDMNGNVLSGFLKPSREGKLHIAIYRARPDVSAIIHAHNPFTVGITLAGKKIEPVNYEAWTMFKDVPILEFKLPGSEDLANLVAQNIKSNSAVILQNHGVVTVGKTLMEALYIAETLEEVSTMIFVASCLGGAKLIPREYMKD